MKLKGYLPIAEGKGYGVKEISYRYPEFAARVYLLESRIAYFAVDDCLAMKRDERAILKGVK